MAAESLIDRLRQHVYARYRLDESLPLVDSVRELVRPLRKHLHYGQELVFKWPPNTPTEVRKLVGQERYDPRNSHYTLPFFWTNEPATTYWGLIICAIECGFGLICFLLNLIHFAIYLPGHSGVGWPGEIFAITLMQLAVFFTFKVLFVFGLLCKNPRLLRWQLMCQYATCVVLFFNAGFAIAADFGGYREQKFYVIRNPPLIRIAAFLSIIFIFVQLYLRMMAWPVCKFIIDTQKFKEALHNAKWRYKKRVYFTYCSIVQQELKDLHLKTVRSNNELKRLSAMEESFKNLQESYKTNGSNGINFPNPRPTTKYVKNKRNMAKKVAANGRRASFSSNSSVVSAALSSASQPIVKKSRTNRNAGVVRIEIELDQKTIRRAVNSQLQKRAASRDRAPLTVVVAKT